MKKVSIVFLCLLATVLITGCNLSKEKEQKLVCTSTENEDGLIVEQVISMTYKNDKLKYMTMEVNSKIIDSNAEELWEEFKKSMDEDNQEFNIEGINFTVSVNDQNYEYDTVLDIDIDKASEDALKEHGFEGLKNDNSTIEYNKELAEKDGSVCEIK